MKDIKNQNITAQFKNKRKRQRESWYSNIFNTVKNSLSFTFWDTTGQDNHNLREIDEDVQQPKKKRRIGENLKKLIKISKRNTADQQIKCKSMATAINSKSQTIDVHTFDIQIPSKKQSACLEIRASSLLRNQINARHLVLMNKCNDTQSVDGWTLRSKENPGQYSRLFGVKPLESQSERSLTIITNVASDMYEFPQNNSIIIWPESKFIGQVFELIDPYGRVHSTANLSGPIISDYKNTHMVNHIHKKEVPSKITEFKDVPMNKSQSSLLFSPAFQNKTPKYNTPKVKFYHQSIEIKSSSQNPLQQTLLFRPGIRTKKSKRKRFLYGFTKKKKSNCKIPLLHPSTLTLEEMNNKNEKEVFNLKKELAETKIQLKLAQIDIMAIQKHHKRKIESVKQEYTIMKKDQEEKQTNILKHLAEVLTQAKIKDTSLWQKIWKILRELGLKDQIKKLPEKSYIGSIIIVIGPIGSGKTTMAKHLAHTLTKENIPNVHINGDDFPALGSENTLKLGKERNVYTRGLIHNAIMNGKIPVIGCGGGVLFFKRRFTMTNELKCVFQGDFKVIVLCATKSRKNVIFKIIGNQYDLTEVYHAQDIVRNAIDRRLNNSEWNLPQNMTKDNFINKIIKKSRNNKQFMLKIANASDAVFGFPLVLIDDFTNGEFNPPDFKAVCEFLLPVLPKCKGTMKQLRILTQVKLLSSSNNQMTYLRFGHITLRYDKVGFSLDASEFEQLNHTYRKTYQGKIIDLHEVIEKESDDHLISLKKTFVEGQGVSVSGFVTRKHLFTLCCLTGNGKLIRSEEPKICITGPSGPIERVIDDHGDGTYSVSYIPIDVGEHQIDVNLLKDESYQSILNSPFTINIKKGCLASASYAEGDGLSRAFENEPAFFTIYAKDENGNFVDDEWINVRISSNLDGDDESMLNFFTLLPVDIQGSGNGKYIAKYHPQQQGSYSVTVKIAGETIKNMPTKLLVYPKEYMEIKKSVLSTSPTKSAVNTKSNKRKVTITTMITTPKRAMYNLRSKSSIKKNNTLISTNTNNNKSCIQKDEIILSQRTQQQQKQEQVEKIQTPETKSNGLQHMHQKKYTWQDRPGGAKCKLIVVSGVDGLENCAHITLNSGAHRPVMMKYVTQALNKGKQFVTLPCWSRNDPEKTYRLNPLNSYPTVEVKGIDVFGIAFG